MYNICITSYFTSKPFAEPGNPLIDYFLPKEYAVVVPASILVLGIVFLGIMMGIALIKEGRKHKLK